MDLPRVDSCLFGLLDLRIGTIIAGVVTLFVTGGIFGYQYTGQNSSLLQSLLGLLVLFGIISSVLVIIGVLINNKQLVQVYVVVYTILLIAVIVLFVLYLLKIKQVSFYRDTSDAIVNTIIYILVVGYCLVVANSYYLTV